MMRRQVCRLRQRQAGQAFVRSRRQAPRRQPADVAAPNGEGAAVGTGASGLNDCGGKPCGSPIASEQETPRSPERD